MPAAQLPAREADAWREIHEAPHRASSPFLHPEYVRAVAAVRGGVQVAVIRRQRTIVGFVPFQRTTWGLGGPVGSRLCDCAGALTLDGVAPELDELVRVADLRALRLTNVPCSLPASGPSRTAVGRAPFIDLRDGYDAYRDSQRARSNLLPTLERLARKATRDVGPIRFCWHTRESGAFDALLTWKAAQRRATRTPDILGFRWSLDLLQRIRAQEQPGFAGVLSTIHIGDTLAAVHLGMRSREVLHYWIPAYNPDLQAFSPGLLLLTELARAASSRGIRKLDLGPGDERYKLRAMSGSLEMGEVLAVRPGGSGVLIRTLYGLRAFGRRSGAAERVRPCLRVARRAGYAIGSALERRAGRNR